ncbi:MAG: ABC transporter permease [Proteobacteria bacterium]|jgi:Cu-processing system permease protein|nr:ABC transporter permease [Pseudomonadota bacterium]
MTAVLTVAAGEIRSALRNRWVLSATLVLAALALSLALLGSAPTGTVGVAPLDVTVVSLTSLTIFLVPLIALLLSHDAIVGERERGTLLLLLSYPLARWQVIAGKFIGHTAVVSIAVTLGYGSAGLVIAWLFGGIDSESMTAFAALIGSSIVLGAAFLALGYLVSVCAPQRATAIGVAVAIWLVLVLVYDAALLGILVADTSRSMPAELVQALLVLNPADAFRLFNLAGLGRVGTFSGMAAVSQQAHAGGAILISMLILWTALPLLGAAVIFGRREV